MRRVDAHCHFWRLDRGDYGWLDAAVPALDPIRRDVAPAEMAPLAAAAGIGSLVAVQAAPSTAETAYLLGLAQRHHEIEGVVGWVDLADPSAVADIDRFAADPAFKGVRPMLQDLEEDDWIAARPRADALARLSAHGLRFDALVMPRHLAPLYDALGRWPDIAVVIDHAAKPALRADADDPRHVMWREGMARLAADTGAFCKLSGLLTEMAPEQRASPKAALATLRPVLDRLLDWFGPERLMWGSDWPVLTLAASHAEWVALTDTLLKPLDEASRAAILGGTARRFYGLTEETL
ncbi:amidohydrolase family protein [Acuticoccus mangrovi]|uniref:Amidohydrolase family protein n=1 Tax=Acuticoccus mangrovi TaxID=2796142 RepID=A0A934ILL5_9HYPH|nr:amidohydrolase family protein [Acuticoccus mangrovi]MBJ3774517.1 amidohydrolase family protein [Acuticoccus mangrovi]